MQIYIFRISAIPSRHQVFLVSPMMRKNPDKGISSNIYWSPSGRSVRQADSKAQKIEPRPTGVYDIFQDTRYTHSYLYHNARRKMKAASRGLRPCLWRPDTVLRAEKYSEMHFLVIKGFGSQWSLVKPAAWVRGVGSPDLQYFCGVNTPNHGQFQAANGFTTSLLTS